MPDVSMESLAKHIIGKSGSGQVMTGDPDPLHISMSFVERQNSP
jgi:hypothetical protein